MRSPLEHDPDLVLAIGTITVRWSLMESSLAELVGSVIASEYMGQQAFYALSTFSQRMALAERITIAGLRDNKAKKISAALFQKVARLWKTRNRLVHSPYVYRVDRMGGGSSTFYQSRRDLGDHPSKRQNELITAFYDPREEQTPEVIRTRHERALANHRVKHEGFAYISVGASGDKKIVPINSGAFQSHAEKLSRRIRQIQLLKRYIDQGVISPSIPRDLGQQSQFAKLSPRSPLANQ